MSVLKQRQNNTHLPAEVATEALGGKDLPKGENPYMFSSLDIRVSFLSERIMFESENFVFFFLSGKIHNLGDTVSGENTGPFFNHY